MATWYDTGDPASADGSEDNFDQTITWNDNSGLLSLPAGTVDALRVYAASDITSTGIKIGLYDSSHNLVSGASGTNSNEGLGAGWKTVTFTPVSISSATYYISINANTSSGIFYAALTSQTSGTTFAHFGSGYASFPYASQGSQDSNRTTLLYVGVSVTVTSSASSPKLALLGVG